MTDTAPGAARPRRPRRRRTSDSTSSTPPTSTAPQTDEIDDTPVAEVAATPASTVTTPTGFAALGVPADVDRGLAAAGFAAPFAIQTEAIPVALTGKDVCGRARTGSGKTLAFGVPMLARIDRSAEPNRPLGLVLVPTRELALQVAEVLSPIARTCGRSVLAAYGGSSRQDQVKLLDQGVDIMVCTPLRLVDLIKGKEVDLSSIEVVVVDEADRMADDGFTPQVEWILRHVTGPHQTMLFSATLDGQVGHLVRRYLIDPVEISIDAANDTVGTMHHLFLGVHHMDRDKVIAAICKTSERVVVFCGTKRMCDRVTDNLRELGISAAAIHGDLPQPAREKALKRFSVGELRALVATDVAARGIDVDGIDVVIHHEPAADAKAYLHRSGRTARAGNDGWAVTMVEYNQHLHTRMIQRALRLPLTPPIEVFSNDKRLADLHSFFPAAE